MIRFLFRFLGLICLALAFIFLVYDGNRSIADQMIHLTKFEEIWNSLYSQTPQEILRPLVDRIFAGWLWDPVIDPDPERADLRDPRLPRRDLHHGRPQEEAADRLRARLSRLAPA